MFRVLVKIWVDMRGNATQYLRENLKEIGCGDDQYELGYQLLGTTLNNVNMI